MRLKMNKFQEYVRDEDLNMNEEKTKVVRFGKNKAAKS